METSKITSAKAMTLGEYNAYRGWGTNEEANPAEEGYLVEYVISEKRVMWMKKTILEKLKEA